MKKNKPNSPISKPQDDSSLADKALSKFNAGQYKEAIELYKTLLKQSVRAEWQQNLAQCYLRRAFEFAAKNMAKEAVVLWENYTQNATPPYQALDAYIAWLLQSNNMVKAKARLNQLSAQQLDEHYPDLACLLGLLIITGKSELQPMLPSDSVFLTQLGIAQTALFAYRNNDRAGVEQALQQLPFRSAFRDLRTILKASLLVSESIESARALLAKIPPTSPYRQVADLLQVTTDSGAVLVKHSFAFDSAQIRLIATAKNLNKKQTELLDVLNKQKNHLSDKLKFNLALQYQTLFDDKLLRHYCLTLALTSYTAGERDFIKHFGDIDKFESNHLLALSCESEHDSYDAIFYWKKCVEALKNQSIDSNYKIALIIRHVAAIEDETDKQAAYLIESLEYDADDLESYLKILHCYENENKFADNFKQWLAKSIEKFPKNIEILNLAIKASVRNKAFKKATQYALALLKIDPINTAAKQILFSSFMAHARKLIKTKKFHLVEKELQQAEAIVLSKHYQMLVAVMRGFYILVAEDKNQGALAIASAVEKRNDGLFNSHFFVAMEALLLDLPIAVALKNLPPLPKDYALSAQELLQLVPVILGYDDEDNNNRVLLQKTLDKFKAIIKRSIKQQANSEAQLLTLCECFARIEQFELLDFCAKQAHKESEWSGRTIRAIWQYYQIVAKTKANASKCSSADIHTLQNGIFFARRQNDDRAAALIEAFIDKYYESAKPFDFFNDLYEEEGSEIDQLFAHLPNTIFQKLEKRMIEIAAKNKPEKMLKILAEHFLSNDLTRLTMILNHPDALFAFFMLKAADELGIDTGVTPNDVIKCLGLK